VIQLGVVIIGRNEGARLDRCLRSIPAVAGPVVYVDSGSTDGSQALARSLGAEVVELDASIPFTAARGRNAGFRRLLALAPAVPMIQFVDGDCELADGWCDSAVAFLAAHPELAAVCGWRRERSPEVSVYNRLCDLEWHAPAGGIRAFGGDVVLRTAALRDAGGYREDLIAGEEPELCVRLRRAGWSLWRLPLPMTVHDAALHRFGQWWRRTRRGGHGFAEGASLHGAAPERHYVVATVRALLWGLALPLAIAGLSIHDPWFALLLLVYPLQVLRLMIRFGPRDPAQRARALFSVIARFPEVAGVLQFAASRIRRRRVTLIEYK
jgi:glycosyltransferase involved in cell wall biosynthesis